MNNQQRTAARRALNAFPSLKVTIGNVDGNETLTPYKKDDVFTRGETIVVTPTMEPSEIEAKFRESCEALANG
jgi:hypothetical protein